MALHTRHGSVPLSCAYVVLIVVAQGFPTLPHSHTKAHKKDGHHKLDVLAFEAETASLQAVSEKFTRTRLAGDEAPIAIYRHGPYDWPALALREESDKVFESSGVIGWCSELGRISLIHITHMLLPCRKSQM